MSRLRRVDCSEPGIRRVRSGRGFRYVEEDGILVREKEVLERIQDLAIPPAWKEVWICPYPMGHLQATGFDAAGRKQYLYHPKWRERRDQQKFDQMLAFAEALPALRRRLRRDLRRPGLTRERVLACAIGLLDLGFFRVGGEQYAEEYDTYGLATVRKRHVRTARGVVVFDYQAKGAQRHVQTVADPQLVKVVRALKNRHGGAGELLAYRNGRAWSDVRSEDINEYLKEASQGDFTAKDFRTWNATVLAAIALARYDGEAHSKTARKRIVREAVSEVARYLSNTPAVCRSAYIDPRVFDRFDSGKTIRDAVRGDLGQLDPGALPNRERVEAAVVNLLT